MVEFMVEEGIDRVHPVGMGVLLGDDRPRAICKSPGHICGDSGVEFGDDKLIVGVEFSA